MTSQGAHNQTIRRVPQAVQARPHRCDAPRPASRSARCHRPRCHAAQGLYCRGGSRAGRDAITAHVPTRIHRSAGRIPGEFAQRVHVKHVAVHVTAGHARGPNLGSAITPDIDPAGNDPVTDGQQPPAESIESAVRPGTEQQRAAVAQSYRDEGRVVDAGAGVEHVPREHADGCAGVKQYHGGLDSWRWLHTSHTGITSIIASHSACCC